MKKTFWLLAIVTALTTGNTGRTSAKCYTPESESDSIKVSKDSLARMSKEEFDANCDSLYNANHPWIKEVTYTDTVKITTPSQRQQRTFSYSNSYVPNSVSVNTSKDVGQIDIEPGTSPSGAKTYNVPIKAYKQDGMFCPDISLVYNSQGGKSAYGKGWSIGGLQSITRGNKSIYYDGETKGMEMNDNDVFYLNGVRLIHTTGNEYETEEGKIKAVANVDGDVVKYFNVYYPNGYTAVFGSTSETSNRVEYPIKSMTNTRGQSITYSYFSSGDTYFLSAIYYGSGGYISCSYNNTGDDYQYRGGKSLNNNRLLESITCRINGAYIGIYSLSYTTNNGISLLSQIDFSVNGNSFNPLIFYYGDGSAVQGYYTNSGILMNGYIYENRLAMTAIRGRFDYTSGNDGILFYPNKNPYYLKKSILSPYLYLHNYYDVNTNIFLYDNLNGDSTINQTSQITSGSGFIQMLTANLDGWKQDRIIKVNNNVDNNLDKVKFTIYQNVAIGLVEQDSCIFSYSTVYTDNNGIKSVKPKYYYTGDFNGDGKAEIMAITAADPFETGSGTSMCYIYDLNDNATLYSGNLFNFEKYLEGNMRSADEAENMSDKVFTMDYNGDGKTDLCHINSSGLRIYTFNHNGSAWTPSLAATYTGLTKSTLENIFWSVGDFNGDGLTDIVCSGRRGWLGNTNWYFLYSKGDGTFSSSIVIGPNMQNNTSDFLIQDVNGDGISDLVELTDNNFTVHTMNKNILTQEATQSLPNTSEYLSPVTINSSSLSTQFVSLLGTNVTLYSYKTNLRTDQALTGMANSNGVVEKNYYYSISIDNTGIYSQNSEDYTFPYIGIFESLPVLAGNEIFMGGVSKDVNHYSYQNAVAHLQGLGFRGFRSVKTTNKRGQTTTHTYKPADYCLPESVFGPGFQTTYNYTTSFDPTYNKIRKSLLTSKTERDLLRNVTATTSYTYGFYSQLLTENTTYPGNISVNKAYNYTHYPNISSKYHLARPDSITTTITRGSSQHSEKTLYKSYNSYDEPRTIVNKVNGNVVKTTNFVYDSYGNITSQSVYPYSSQTARTTTYEYDYYNRLTKIIDPLGMWKEYTYNTDGTIASTRTYIGYTYYNYDAFGRQISETRPDTTTVSTSFTWNTGNGGLYAVTKSGTNMPTETTVYDALNREVRQQQTRFDGNQLKVDKLYDTYGNLQKESYPYKTGSPTYIQYSYDLYDRLVTKSEIGKTTSYTYNDLSTTVYDGTVSTTTTTDALGGVVSVTDPAGTINYTLNGAGNPTSISAPASSGNGITTSITYDTYGRRTSIADPSSGTTTYSYHISEGYLQSETNAKGQTTSYVCDIHGRTTQKTSSEFSTTYTYNNLNKITAETSSNGTSTTYSYDALGRLSSTRENAVDSKWLQKDYTYSGGRVSAIKYTSQNGVLTTENHYYTNGHLTSVKLNGTSTIFTLSGEDGQGRPGNITTGGLSRYYNYTVSGYPTSRIVTASGYAKQNIQYSFSEQTGNLASRSYPLVNKTENFSYDNLNRLTSFGSHSVSYDNNGNITSKGDVGNFVYNLSGKPYAVSDVTLTSNISVGTQNVSYYSFDRPNEISDNGYTATFIYNGNYDRVKMALLHNSSASLTRYYLGGCYELDVKPSGTTERLYLNGGYYDAPTVLIKQGNTSSVYQILRDHLGSITHVLNSSGTIVQELSYDAWGRLRNPSTFTLYTPTNEPELFLGRGYCGHEHLTGLGLINMNARLYDPLLGRFLSPDPYVQAPEHSQSFNRYSYCINNPLKYNDRSGELFGIDDLLIGAAIGALISATTYSVSTLITGQRWSMNSFCQSVGIGALGGFLGAASGAIGSALGSSIGNSLGYNILSQTANTVITNTVFGNNIKWNDIFGIVAGAAAGTALPKYTAIKAKPLVNTLAETGFNTVRGAATGAIKGCVDAIIKNDSRYFYMDMVGGALSGFSRTIATNVVFGAPFERQSFGIKNHQRTGGIASLLKLGRGLTMGTSSWVVSKDDIDTSYHEDWHVVQQSIIGGGWADFYNTIGLEYLEYGFKNSYHTEGSLEYWANQYMFFRMEQLINIFYSIW